MTVDRPREGYRPHVEPGACGKCKTNAWRSVSETIERCVECERRGLIRERVRKDPR